MQADIEPNVTWRKSSYSGGGSSGGDCVEVAALIDHAVVRDSKNAHSPVLAFGHNPWRTFLHNVAAMPRN
ncbi:DUF397 domain-containing protein [Streptomyces sp. NPDC003023]|uniref:DUF397 domain-containing protein n=1 Tax=Streptomyces sp. NPDC003023 TaxID=3364675 RepID=UPI003691F53A